MHTFQNTDTKQKFSTCFCWKISSSPCDLKTMFSFMKKSETFSVYVPKQSTLLQLPGEKHGHFWVEIYQFKKNWFFPFPKEPETHSPENRKTHFPENGNVIPCETETHFLENRKCTFWNAHASRRHNGGPLKHLGPI